MMTSVLPTIDSKASLHPFATVIDAEKHSTNGAIASLLLALVLAYTVFAMVQGLISFSLNRLVGAFIILVLLCDFLKHLTGPKVIATCVICISAVLCLGVFSTDRSRDFEFFTYLSCTLLFLGYIARITTVQDIRLALRRWRTPIAVCLTLCTLLAAYALITRTGYVKSWGGDNYFAGFTNGEHAMASIACLLMAVAFFSFKDGGFGKLPTLIVFTVFSWAAFETGARTFLVPIAILWVLLVNDESVVKQRWLRIALMTLLVIAAVFVFASSSMATKFDYINTFASTSNKGEVDSFTSGRLDYWRVDLAGFFNSAPLNQLFGNSASFVHALNNQVFHMPIWAHDDFVMILCSAGYAGLLVYVGVLAVFFKNMKPMVCRWQYWLLLVYVLFPAVVNGFYGYQHLMYSAMLLTCTLVCLGRDGTEDLNEER